MAKKIVLQLGKLFARKHLYMHNALGFSHQAYCSGAVLHLLTVFLNFESLEVILHPLKI